MDSSELCELIFYILYIYTSKFAKPSPSNDFPSCNISSSISDWTSNIGDSIHVEELWQHSGQIFSHAALKVVFLTSFHADFKFSIAFTMKARKAILKPALKHYSCHPGLLLGLLYYYYYYIFDCFISRGILLALAASSANFMLYSFMSLLKLIKPAFTCIKVLTLLHHPSLSCHMKALLLFGLL